MPDGDIFDKVAGTKGDIFDKVAARPSEAEQAANAPIPGVKNPMQMMPNNLMQTLTSRPLTGMESGLSSPAQDPNTAEKMGYGAAIGAPVGGLISGGVAALPAIGRSLAGSAVGSAAGGWTGGQVGGMLGPTGKKIGTALGALIGGVGGGISGYKAGPPTVPPEYVPVSKSPGPYRGPSSVPKPVVPEPPLGSPENPGFMSKLPTRMPKPQVVPLSQSPYATQNAAAQSFAAGEPGPNTPLTQSPLATQQKAATSFAAGEAGPNTPMSESPYLNGQKAVAAQLQGNALAKAKAAGKPTIYTPDSPPPPINKTLVSYDGPQLLKKAKTGDIDAINELIRNPRGIDLEQALPNVKFLIEGGRPTRIYGGPGSTK